MDKKLEFRAVQTIEIYGVENHTIRGFYLFKDPGTSTVSGFYANSLMRINLRSADGLKDVQGEPSKKKNVKYKLFTQYDRKCIKGHRLWVFLQ